MQHIVQFSVLSASVPLSLIACNGLLLKLSIACQVGQWALLTYSVSAQY